MGGVSEKWSLRYVVEPRSIHQMNTCGGFLCHAEALKKQNRKTEKPKNRSADKCEQSFVSPGGFQTKECRLWMAHKLRPPTEVQGTQLSLCDDRN